MQALQNEFVGSDADFDSYGKRRFSGHLKSLPVASRNAIVADRSGA